jgi:LysM repeat protein
MPGQKLLVYVSVPKKVAVRNVNVLDDEDETAPDAVEDAVVVNMNDNSREPDSLQNVTTSNPVPEDTAKSGAIVKTESPKPATKVASKTPVKNSKPADAKVKQYVYHVVQPGDTLWSIAQRYDGISVDELKRVNKISNSKNLKPGTKLKIKVKA